ncbi:MAG: hypothetical protein AAF127_03200 [Pseudomonadota bacterium]
MAELIYALVSYSIAPLVSIGFILIVFLIVPRFPVFARALVASLIASVLTVGPGTYYNVSEGLNDDVNPFIYFGIFWLPTLIVSWLVSWLFARRLVLPPEQLFQ